MLSKLQQKYYALIGTNSKMGAYNVVPFFLFKTLYDNFSLLMGNSQSMSYVV